MAKAYFVGSLDTFGAEIIARLHRYRSLVRHGPDILDVIYVCVAAGLDDPVLDHIEWVPTVGHGVRGGVDPSARVMWQSTSMPCAMLASILVISNSSLPLSFSARRWLCPRIQGQAAQVKTFEVIDDDRNTLPDPCHDSWKCRA